MNKLLLVTSSHSVTLSDRRAAPAPASNGEPIVASRGPPPHTSRRTVIQMKSFRAAAVILAIIALGVGQSAAQTGATSPGGMVGAPSPSGIGATSPLGMDFGQSPDNSQSTTATTAGAANPAPCTSGLSGATGLSPFDGGGVSLAPSSNMSGLLGSSGGRTSTAVPCNSVSSSGVVSTPNSATITSSANSSASASSASSSVGSPTTATANSSPNTKSLGVTALGTSGLGTTGL